MHSAKRIVPATARAASRRPHLVARRFATTEAAPQQSAGASHALAGVAGGAVVLGGMYLWYRQSGAATAVNTTKQVIDTASAAKNKVVESAPSPSQAVELFKSFTKSYVAAVPGAGPIVDSVFAKIDELSKEHGEEVQKIASKAYNDISAAINDKKGGSEKILAALTEAANSFSKIAGDEGGKVLDKLYEKSPELKNIVGGSSEQLQKLADKYGPEAKKIADDTYAQVQNLIQKGGLNVKTYEQAKKLLEEKTQQITALASKGSSDAWEAGSKAAAPLLDKIPDVKKQLDEKLNQAKGFVGEENVKKVQDLYAELEKIQKSDKSVEDKAKAAKKLVEDRIGSFDGIFAQAKDLADSKTGDFAKYASSIPGLGALGKIVDSEDLKNIKAVAEKHGKDAEKILEGAYEDIKQVLKKRAEEAKKVAESAKNEATK